MTGAKKLLVLLALASVCYAAKAQDTFSILAYDSISREVGAAGASCVNLNFTSFSDHFIAELFPDTGAIATQASYIQTNQVTARARMRAGDSPGEIIAYMLANDVQSDPSARQYGVVKFGDTTAAYTGSNCMAHKAHRTGRNYSIQGNILLATYVLDSMEARFLRAKGDLACRLMEAMQGAKMPGADSRCFGYTTSSLFAFVKVASPTDTLGKPGFLVSVRTQPWDSIEPIDSLQVLFDLKRSCVIDETGINGQEKNPGFSIIPNPASGEVLINTGEAAAGWLRLRDVSGRVLKEVPLRPEIRLNTAGLSRGIYFVEIHSGEKRKSLKLLVE